MTGPEPVRGYTRWQWAGLIITALALLALMTLPIAIA